MMDFVVSGSAPLGPHACGSKHSANDYIYFMHRFVAPALGRRYFYHTTSIMSFHSVNIANQKVRVNGCSSTEEFNQVMSFQPFKDWLAAFDQQQKTRENEMIVETIQIQNIDYFGSKKVGFVKFKTQATFKDSGKNVPGIVFMVTKKKSNDAFCYLVLINNQIFREAVQFPC